jgi:hypothetical protein
MNTKILMSISAIVMTTAGVLLTFLPQEINAMLGSANAVSSPVILQIIGALYFAFGMINWTAKANLIGGIYGRPIAIGNLSHFTIGGLALLKAYSTSSPPVLLVIMIVYIVFGIAFGYVFVTHPVPQKAA